MVQLVVVASVISTLSLDGDVTPEGGDYVRVPFEVPEGTVEIHLAHASAGEGSDILDFGVEDPDGFRGWCGGLQEDTVIGAEESSRCYLPGPIEPGTWYLDIGRARLTAGSLHWTAELEFRDESTLTPRQRAPWQPRVLERGARWYRGDLHVHSLESGDGHADFERIHQAARLRPLDFVNVSDHNTITQIALLAAYQEDVDDLLFLRGSEVTTYGGHGTALGNASYIDHHIGRDGRTIDDVLEQVADDGGLFIINHPKLDAGNACIGCGWTFDDVPLDLVTGLELHTDAYDFFPIFGRAVIQMWDDMLDRGYRVVGTAGGDDHNAALETVEGQSRIGTPTTLVWAEELGEAALMDGIRHGRVVVQLRGPDDPMVELSAETDAGESGMIGDTVHGGAISLRATVSGGRGLALALWRNGAIDEWVTVDQDEFTHVFERETRPEGDRYRLHLVEDVEVVITNHIWAEYQAVPDDGSCGCGAAGPHRGVAGAQVAMLVVLALAVGFAGRSRRAPRGPLIRARLSSSCVGLERGGGDLAVSVETTAPGRRGGHSARQTGSRL